jgi:hypothetical protein
MRARSRHRPHRCQRATVQQDTLSRISQQVHYVGSPEHKDVPSFVGAVRPRADASMCPRDLTDDRAMVEEWLREAVELGNVGTPWEGDFPRYVWYRDDQGRVFEGRLVNRGQGEYKGYPLNHDEIPEWLNR